MKTEPPTPTGADIAAYVDKHLLPILILHSISPCLLDEWSQVIFLVSIVVHVALEFMGFRLIQACCARYPLKVRVTLKLVQENR